MMDTEYHIYGAPDDFGVYYGETEIGECYYENDDAFPFTISNGKLYIGSSGGKHGSIKKIVGIDTNNIEGRIYLSVYQKADIPFDYTILSFWNDSVKVDGEIINQLLREFDVSPDDVLIAEFEDGEEGTLIPLQTWDYYVPEASQTQKNAYALHLLNAHDKHDATSDFRTIRDNAIYTPREKAAGSMAAYHAMVHTENISRIIRNVLKEYIYKETKRIIF